MTKAIERQPVTKINHLPRLWPHNPNDEDTWMYSDYKTKKVGNDLIITEWIRNPNFKFNV